jgi:hypothetical protein
MRKKVWTPEARRAFAEKMRKARERKRGKNPGRSTVHTAKFDRCVTDVKKSARKYGRKVNAYAVCGAALPHAGVKKGHRRRQRNLKSIGGAVVVVHMGKRPLYFTHDNLLSTNRTTARVFKHQKDAIYHAHQIVRAIGGKYRVTINKP